MGAMLGWPGWVGCAFGAIACRFTVDDTWELLGDGEMFRVLRRRGRSAWTLAAMVGPGVGLSRKGNTVVLRGGEGSARLHLESASEARGMERRLRITRDGLVKGVASTVLITAKVKSGAPRVTNQATVSTLSYESNTANNSASADLRVRRIEQTAKALPASPARVKSGKTDQGKRLTTRVLCRPVKAGALGEVAYCKVTRKGDVVKVTVLGSRKVKVTVIQTAKGGDKYKPFVQRRTYIVKP